MNDILTITEPDDLDEVLNESHRQPVLLFKHSLTCGVSSGALAELRRFAASRPLAAIRLLEVQRARPLSQAVAERTGVRHQSPQALLFRHGEVRWQASHWHIDAAALADAVDADQTGSAFTAASASAAEP